MVGKINILLVSCKVGDLNHTVFNLLMLQSGVYSVLLAKTEEVVSCMFIGEYFCRRHREGFATNSASSIVFFVYSVTYLT